MRGSSTRTEAIPAGTSEEDPACMTTTAPFCTAFAMNRWPSVWAPAMATNRNPGRTSRESCVTPMTFASGSPIIEAPGKSNCFRYCLIVRTTGFNETAVLLKFRGGITPACKLHFNHELRRKLALCQTRHLNRKWYSQVNLRQTEITPIGTHETEIKTAAKNGTPGKGMAVDSGNRNHGIGDNPAMKRVLVFFKFGGSIFIFVLLELGKPVKVKAITPYLGVG